MICHVDILFLYELEAESAQEIFAEKDAREKVVKLELIDEFEAEPRDLLRGGERLRSVRNTQPKREAQGKQKSLGPVQAKPLKCAKLGQE